MAKDLAFSETALYFYGVSVGLFKYLLQQESYMIDLNDTNRFGMNILAHHIARGISAEIASLIITSSRDARFLAAHGDQFGRTSLHWATLALKNFRSPDTSPKQEGMLEFLPTVSKLLSAGADVHAAGFVEGTPLGTLLSRRNAEEKSTRVLKRERKIWTERLGKNILTWFVLLRKAGYDLQEYMEKEQAIHTQGRYIHEPDYWKVDIEKRPGEDAIILRIMDEDWVEVEDVEEQDAETMMPGAYPKTPVRSIRWQYEERDELSFFIGPLKDGVQEFELLDWLGVYYYGGNEDAEHSVG
jgi:hypothetical protein